MSEYKFQPNQRYAVYTVHGSCCYLCGVPIDLQSMQVDHIFPESLLENHEKLRAALKAFDLSSNFNLNDYENWLPACSPCNLKKKATIFRPMPIISIHLDRAKKYAQKTRETAERISSKQKVSRALNIVLQAAQFSELSEIELEILEKIGAQYLSDKRSAEVHKVKNPIDGAPEYRTRSNEALELRLTPLHTILYENGSMRMVKAPYGVGFQPTDPNPHSSFRCGHCGSIGPWQGARCLTCGYLDDGD